MPKYGIIVEGQLTVSYEQKEGYKPIEYAPVPVFDQMTQYVIQKQPIEFENKIYIGVEVKSIEIGDEEFDE